MHHSTVDGSSNTASCVTIFKSTLDTAQTAVYLHAVDGHLHTDVLLCVSNCCNVNDSVSRCCKVYGHVTPSQPCICGWVHGHVASCAAPAHQHLLTTPGGVLCLCSFQVTGQASNDLDLLANTCAAPANQQEHAGAAAANSPP
jgi:hypothetical protein